MLLPTADEPVPVLLMNTIWADRTTVHDVLDLAGGLRAWLEAVGPRLGGARQVGGAVRQGDVEQFRMLRDALRRLAAAATDDTRGRAIEATPPVTVPQAVTALNAAGAMAPAAATLRLPGWETVAAPPPGVRAPVAALSAVARLGVELLGGPDRQLLRACNAPGCVLYFVKDHPRREWCSAACGNRARAARHYRRHRSGVTAVN